MSQLFEQLGVLIEQLIVGMGYFGIALVMLVENLFPPIPSELVMPLAGFFAAKGELNFFGVWLAGTIGSVLGAICLYALGRWANATVIKYMIGRYGRWVGVSVGDVDRALSVFDRHGEIIVFVGRLIPLVRSLISIPAGMHRMPMGKFLLFTTAGSAIWTGLLAGAGVLLGENWSQVLGFLKTYQNVTLIAIAGAAILFVAWWLMRRARRQTIHVEPE